MPVDFNNKTANVSVADWARMAAFIDGEGCLCIRRYFNKTRQAVGHHLRIQIANTDARLVLWLRDTFLIGNVHVRRVGTDKNRTLYTWEVTGKAAEFVLRNCYQYLVVKVDQADVAMRFQQECTGFERNGRGNKLSPEVVAKREELSRLISDLKYKPQTIEVQ